MSELFSVAGADPGKLRDSFALVSIRINQAENEIFVEYAKRWLRKDYMDVEHEIAAMHRKAGWRNIYCEQNNTGEHVIEVLRKKYGVPVKAVTTSGRITDPKKHHRLKVMSKPEMVLWFLKAKQRHMIQFPKKTTNVHMAELERQISIFAEHHTEAGNVAYYAPGEEHDDLVMALLLCCFAARRYLRVTDDPEYTAVMGTLNFENIQNTYGRSNSMMMAEMGFDDWT